VKKKRWTCGTCKGTGKVRLWYTDKAGKRQSYDIACRVCGGGGVITW
jgi:DnaJ-class molecular chaperone